VTNRVSRSAALAAVAGRLGCPHCGAGLTLGDRTLSCAAGHSYDVARHGHVSLLPSTGRPPAGDSEEMVAAREVFLGAGHFAPIAAAVGAAAAHAAADRARGSRGCVVDLGAGTGYYLAAVLGELAGWSGLALDASRPALRRAVQAEARIAGVVCDAWSRLPVRDGGADLVLSVFAPRNATEIGRILAERGTLVVVTPAPDHLRELVAGIGLIGIEPDKSARLHAQLSPHVRAESATSVEFEMALDREMVGAVAGMGPSAHHVGSVELRDRLAGLPDRVRVTSAVILETFRRDSGRS
jgi:23S rRNA (guanine745-N1)-methyltransferase